MTPDEFTVAEKLAASALAQAEKVSGPALAAAEKLAASALAQAEKLGGPEDR